MIIILTSDLVSKHTNYLDQYIYNSTIDHLSCQYVLDFQILMVSRHPHGFGSEISPTHSPDAPPGLTFLN